MTPDALSPLIDASSAGLESILYAIGLLALALALLVLEVFVVSFGLITIVSLACLAGAVYLAFGVGTGFGWLFLAVATVASALVIRWGMGRIRQSKMVPTAQISADAGYRHVAQRIGVDVGSTGVMVTTAYPTGRARFPGGECDVQSRHGPLQVGASVVVQSIDGPVVFVAADEATASQAP